jgi:Asp-tRNA(Asn)/Glu-tRNA(Gln) amidotransferase A subunit family amidase
MIPLALGTQGIGSILRPASYCGCVGYKPTFGAINRGGSHDGLSQSTHGALSATLEDAWIVLREIVERSGGDLGYGGLRGPKEPPTPRKPRCLALLHTRGWEQADSAAKSAFAKQVDRLQSEGIKVIDADKDPGIAAMEECLEPALPSSLRINTWEMRWPLNTYRTRDAAKISPLLLDRLRDAESMTVGGARSSWGAVGEARIQHRRGDCACRPRRGPHRPQLNRQRRLCGRQLVFAQPCAVASFT